VTGEQRDLSQFESKDGRTMVPLEFEPYGGLFVVFRKALAGPDVRAVRPVNFPTLQPIQEITGPWTVHFDPQWFYPTKGLTGDQARGLLVFEKLEDWNKRPEPAVHDFSGTALYKLVFSMQSSVPRQRLFLDLGTVKETARVKLNGKDLGVVWCSPWQVEITRTVRAGENALEIEVVNLWPNRLVGDNHLSGKQRRTRTEMFFGGPDYQFSSGLLGPVTIQAVERTPSQQ
jgi:hypothetical protein